VVTGLLLSALSDTTPIRLDEGFRSVFSGIHRALGSIAGGVGDSLRAVRELNQLRAEHEILLQELEVYRNTLSEMAVVERENQQLRRQLGFLQRDSRALLAARVIAREEGALFRSYTINRGSRHGVQRDQTVIAFIDGVQGFAGRVEMVTPGTAVIIPAYALSSYVSARLERTRHEGLIQGSGERELGMTMNYLPRGARSLIRTGDLIVTSGLNSLFPPGIPIGRIHTLSEPTFEATLSLEVHPVIDFSRLEDVFVILDAESRR
jgi:rod shape-determining protein MreC